MHMLTIFPCTRNQKQWRLVQLNDGKQSLVLSRSHSGANVFDGVLKVGAVELAGGLEALQGPGKGSQVSLRQQGVAR